MRQRSRVLYIAASLAILAASLSLTARGVAASRPASSSTGAWIPAPAEPGTAIPTASVAFGMRPYADNTFYVVAMKKGWFKDVGIQITPAPYGLKVTDAVVTSLLLKGQLDVSSEYCPLLLPLLKTETVLKCFGFVDTFQGWAILARPGLHLKTVNDYMKQGLPFKQALRKALQPLMGKTLVVAPQLSARPFVQIAFKLAGLPLPQLEVLDDSKSLVLAKSGRIDFATPEGAPITLTFEKAGWAPLVSPIDLLQNVPGGRGSAVEPLGGTVGLASRSDYLNAHQNTILRFLSVVFRTIAAIQADPGILSLQAPYLNSVAGTNLDARGVATTLKVLDPLSNFAYQANYCSKKNSALYYQYVYDSLLKTFERQGVLPSGKFPPDDAIWACQVYRTLLDFQHRTASLLASLSGKQLSTSQRSLVASARKYEGWFDFLDAYHFAKAASK